MGIEGDIMRLEVEIMKSAMLNRKEELENKLHIASGLTYEQWTTHYAEKFRREVDAILKKTGKLPTKEQVELTLYHG